MSIGAIPGINDFAAELLYQAGFKSAEEVSESELEDILDVEGISKEKAESLHKSAKEYVAEKRLKAEEEKISAGEQTVELPPAEPSSPGETTTTPEAAEGITRG
jgi:transcription termination factor NusA